MFEFTSNDLRLLGFDLFREHPFVTAAVSTRRGAGNNEFSIAWKEDDNRAALARALGFQPGHIIFLNQVHSSLALRVDEPFKDVPEADALVTDVPGLLIAGLSADCPIVLLYDPVHNAVGMAHGSWRGATGQIGPNTLKLMEEEYGTLAGDVLAAIGPGIGQCCFEVGPEVIDAAMASTERAEECIRETSGEKPHLDLRKLNRVQLIEAGVAEEHIEESDFCTRCRTDLFFSYRGEGENTGRFAGVIGINPPAN